MLGLSNAALVGFFTLGGVLLSGVITAWTQARARRAESGERRRERREDEQRQWRERAAPTLGRVREFLTDVHPDRVLINFNRNTEQQLVERMNADWEEIRAPLAELAVGLPSQAGRDLADQLLAAAHRAWSSTGWAVRDLSQHRDFKDQRDRAMNEWNEADRLAKELRNAIHAVERDGI